VVTDRLCEEHGMFHIRIINKGKRPWDLGCPHCNFLEWQARKAQEKAEGKESGEEKGAKPQPAKKTARKAGGATRAKKTAGKSSSAKGDGLASLPGVGPKTLEKLEAAGVRTSQDLLSSKAKALAEKTGLSEKKIAVWMKAAKALS
jgi:DNA topoisomerase-1